MNANTQPASTPSETAWMTVPTIDIMWFAKLSAVMDECPNANLSAFITDDGKTLVVYNKEKLDVYRAANPDDQRDNMAVLKELRTLYVPFTLPFVTEAELKMASQG